MRRYSPSTGDSRDHLSRSAFEDSGGALLPSTLTLPFRTTNHADTPDSGNINISLRPLIITDSASCPDASRSSNGMSFSGPANSHVPSSCQQLRCSSDADDASSTGSFHSTACCLEAAVVEGPMRSDGWKHTEEREHRAEQAPTNLTWSTVGLVYIHPMLRENLASVLCGNEPDIDSQRATTAAPANSFAMENIGRFPSAVGVLREGILSARHSLVSFLQRASSRRLQQSGYSGTASEPVAQPGWDGLYGLKENERSLSSTSDLVYDDDRNVGANKEHGELRCDDRHCIAELDKDGPIPQEYRPLRR